MPRRKHIDPFLLAVVDKDKNIFSVEGPMVDDRPWNDAVCRAQEEGRQVNCFTLGTNREDAIAELERLYGWRLVEPGTIVHRSF